MKRAANAEPHVCGGNLRCINSRPHKGYRLRRYECTKCAERITTVEVEMPGDFNSKASVALAISRVTLHFVRNAPTEMLVREIKNRTGLAALTASSH